MGILIVIPARGGSKGIPLKNIYEINGKPLIQYTIDFAKALPFKKDILVSTDLKKIATTAIDLGVACPFLRPPQLSTDYIGDMQVLRHSLIEFEKFHNKTYEIVIMLQPTSPIRFENQVISAINKISNNSFDSIISVSQIPLNFHALKQFKLTGDKLTPFTAESKQVYARQQLEKSYIRNGVVYIFKPNFVLNSDSVFSDNTGYLVTDEKYVNIDSYADVDEFQKYLLDKEIDKI
jgi:CMP-N,N'-diacetyllegionaminic acid synthase